MAQKATSTACLCQNTHFPGSLDDLRNAEYLDCDLEALALIGTQLSEALISTNNGAALLTGKGGYGSYQTTAMAHRVSRRRVNLRIAPQVNATLAREPTGTNGRKSIVVANSQGVISHRIEAADAYDQAVLNALDTRAEVFQQPTPYPRNDIVSLTAVRDARTLWHERDSGQHLNDILHDGGVTRRATLPHVGTNKAWLVLDQVLTSFIAHLHDQTISYALLVPGHGLMQMAIRVAGHAKLAQKILISQCDNSIFALDLAQVESVWASRFGPISQLEIYAADGRCIALIAPDPNGDISHWNALLESLPLSSKSP